MNGVSTRSVEAILVCAPSGAIVVVLPVLEQTLCWLIQPFVVLACWFAPSDSVGDLFLIGVT